MTPADIIATRLGELGLRDSRGVMADRADAADLLHALAEGGYVVEEKDREK